MRKHEAPVDLVATRKRLEGRVSLDEVSRRFAGALLEGTLLILALQQRHPIPRAPAQREGLRIPGIVIKQTASS